MSRPRDCFTAAFFLLIIPCIVPAQETDNGSTRADPEVERKALDLLETIAERIPNLRAPGNRVQLACSVAELLWPRDEERARTLFENVTRDMAALVAGVDFSDQDSHNGWIQQQRRQILERMAHHDPELALTFLRATRQPSPNSSPSGAPDNETNLEVLLAGRVAAKNPEMALSMARASLAQGVSHNLLGLLSQLQQKDPAAAQKFHREVVDRINDSDLVRNQQTASVAWSLLSSFQPPQADEQTYREFIENLIRRTLPITPGEPFNYQVAQNLYHQLRGAMPLVEKHAPTRAPALRQWFQNVERTFDPTQRMHNELNEIYQKTSAQEILGIASKYPAEMRPQIYQQAVWKVLNSGEPDLARQIANEFLSGHQQQQMLSQIENHMLWKAVNENKLAEARRLLNAVRVADRLQIVTQLAARLANNGDKEGALALLDEARGLLVSLPPGSRKLMAQLQLAHSYTAIDVDQSKTILQSVIAQVNELVAAASVLDGFENRYLRDGEWMAYGPNGLSNFVNNLDQNLGQLATRDLDSARMLSDQLERIEIRLKTQLAIVQAVLGAPSRSIPTLKGRRFVTN